MRAQKAIRVPRAARALLTALAFAAAGALGGCGGSHASGTAADPASVVPANAPLYAGAVVRPTGAIATGARVAAQRLTHQTDPYLRLLGALRTPGSATLDFKRDVAPWLGPRAGVFSSAGGVSPLLQQLLSALQSGAATLTYPFAAAAAQGGIVLDTSDMARARSFLRAQAALGGASARTYRGVAYEATAGGAAFGLVHRFAVIGSEPALRAVIDTAAAGSSLASAAAYTRLSRTAPAGALAHVYVAGSALAGGAQAAGPAPAGVAQGLLGLLGSATANVSLLATPAALALDIDSLPSGGGPGVAGGLATPDEAAARAFGELPGESFFALSFGGEPALAANLQALESIGALAGSGPPRASSAGLSVSGLLGGFLVPLRALTANTPQARRDFQSWIGGGGIFASGSGLLDLKAGIVISSRDAALSRAAVAKLGASVRSAGGSVQAAAVPGADAALSARVPGVPVLLDIADGRDSAGQAKFVIGVGEASVAAALRPASALSGSASSSSAASALGEGIQPSLMVQVPTVLGLLEGVGLSEDPSVAPLLPYLRSTGTVAGGHRRLGEGISRLRVVLGLRGEG